VQERSSLHHSFNTPTSQRNGRRRLLFIVFISQLEDNRVAREAPCLLAQRVRSAFTTGTINFKQTIEENLCAPESLVERWL
jgi:hypothetical protein